MLFRSCGWRTQTPRVDGLVTQLGFDAVGLPSEVTVAVVVGFARAVDGHDHRLDNTFAHADS